MPKSFDVLGKRGQVSRLKLTAAGLLRQYPIAVSDLKLITHAFNTTFKVVTDEGVKFALRLNTNSLRDEGEMNAEVAWVKALANDTGLRVPIPQATKDGENIAEAWSDDLERKVRGVLYSWLPGKNADVPLHPSTAKAMGEATRIMHEHGRTFVMPKGAALHPLEDTLFGYEFFEGKLPPELDRGVFTEVIKRGNALIGKINRQKLMPIHYDLHYWNVKWLRGKLSVFDFDDTIMGTPIMDAYVTLFYLRGDRENAESNEDNYWQGLQSSPEQMGHTPEEFELLVASRAPLLVNEFFRHNTAGYVDRAPDYARITEKRLRHYLDTGKFDPRVARMP